jgi:hypothetical protein
MHTADCNSYRKRKERKNMFMIRINVDRGERRTERKERKRGGGKEGETEKENEKDEQ